MALANINPLIPTTVLVTARTAAVVAGAIPEMELLPENSYTFTATNLGASETFTFEVYDYSLSSPDFQSWLFGGAQVKLTQNYDTITISGIHAIVRIAKSVTASASGLSYSIRQNINGSIAPGITGATNVNGTQGTGSSYDPPSGGSGLSGWLSGIFRNTTKPRTYTKVSDAALTTSWVKILTTTPATTSLRMSAACDATTYDIEYTFVAAGAAAPTDTRGQALLAGEDFLAGIPVGDIYARSATLQRLIVWSA